MFRINRDNQHIAERIAAFDRPARRAPQPPIPGPVYNAVVTGKMDPPPDHPTLSQPYPWVKPSRRETRNEPIVGYIGHRPRMREAFSQSTFLPVNERASKLTTPWDSTYSANFTGHRDEVTRLATSRSAELNERWETMRTLNETARAAAAKGG